MTDQTALLDELRAIVGAENVLTDDADREYYGTSVYVSATPPMAVLRPNTVEALSAAVKAVTDAGLPVVPRGSGNSYTEGYQADRNDAILIDMTGMNRILEINKQDMYVTVEAGCTWSTLYEALKDSGLRTPFWGALSGLQSVVGGGMSQNAIFFGTGKHGTAADSVISMDVVLADGSVVKTGSAGGTHASDPFFRHYGPDLTGLFTADTGALGIKATVTLQLIPRRPHTEFASFAFETFDAMASAMSEMARTGLCEELFGFDPFLQSQRMKRESLARDVKTLGKVMEQGKEAGGVLGALKEGAKMAMSGRHYMSDVKYSCHATVEEGTVEAVKAAIDTVTEIATRTGREIENSIPKIMHAYPFGPLNAMLGPEGENWVPIHGVVPHSRSVAALAALDTMFSSHQADMDRLGIDPGYLVATVGMSGFAIEPVLFWPSAQNALHKRHVEASHLAKLPKREANPEADAKVEVLRSEVKRVLKENGAIHMQIGRAYPYAETRSPAALKLLKQLKAAVDPKGLMNPGSLGL